MKPLIFVNFKAYSQSTGNAGLELAKKLEPFNDSVVVVPQVCDLRTIVENTSLQVFAQHVDPCAQGANTGFVTAEALKAAGCTGTIINHSEHRLSLEEVETAVKRAKEAQLKTLVCVENVEEQKKIFAFAPDMIAIEPPELIGTKDSISKNKPELIKEAVAASTGIPVLCGAGVNDPEDVSIAIHLGSEGILLASAIVKNLEPQELMKEMVDALTL